MKELTIQQKARAYDEALHKAKRIINVCVDDNTECRSMIACIQQIFPELKESEDEKIRKWLLDFVQGLPDEGLDFHFYNLKKEQVIAWLEKQGEPTNINPSEFDLRLNKLLKQFETLPKEELVSTLNFYLNVVKNDGTYKPTYWSDEDEKILNHIISIIENADERLIRIENISVYTNWLKSRVQLQLKWKPTKLQIEALESATANCAYSEYQDCLKELIKQLKQL